MTTPVQIPPTLRRTAPGSAPVPVQGARAARVVTLVLSGLALAWLLWILGSSLVLYAQRKGAAETSPVVTVIPAGANQNSGSPGAAVSATDLQKQVQADVDATLKSEELLLDKLLLLVGLYTTILSFLALATVIVSRQDAKEQLAKVDALASDNKAQLKQILEGTKQEIVDLKEHIRREFPVISELQSRVLGLIQKLEAKYPEDENLNRPQADSWRLEELHQDVLIDELQIVAVSVVVLDKASLLKLYMVLSRSYFDRFRTGLKTDADAARAYLYASRAIDCDSGHAEAFRMRGVSALSRYRSADAARKATDEFKALLLQAKSDLMHCSKLDTDNAGAIYNLALLNDEQGNRSEAIRLSEGLIAPASAERVRRRDQEKYFPDVYINLGCYLADQSKTETDATKQEALWDQVVALCQRGKTYLEAELVSSKAMETFRLSLERELGATGDFAPLSQAKRQVLKGLL